VFDEVVGASGMDAACVRPLIKEVPTKVIAEPVRKLRRESMASAPLD
jgi:hypothetical protein